MDQKNEDYLRSAFRTQSIIGLILLTSGLLGIALPLLISFHNFEWLNKIELDPRAVDDIDSDSQGNIYLSLPFYHRIQKYDAAGKFILSWRPTHGPIIASMRVNDDSQIEVRFNRSDVKQVFSRNGQLIKQEQFNGKPNLRVEASRKRNSNGTKYKVVTLIEDSYLAWIIKETTDPRDSSVRAQIIISPPWYFAFLPPFTASIFMIAAGFFFRWLAHRSARVHSIQI